LIYLWGHLTATHDAMLPLLGVGHRLHPEFDVAFISNPDKTQAGIPSVELVRKAWKEVNGRLFEGFASLSAADWLKKHAAVSQEDFVKEPLRNRLAILLSRTNHLAYHLGQTALRPK
jgi:DNA polymerase/3'-5' exonuclease PolX